MSITLDPRGCWNAQVQLLCNYEREASFRKYNRRNKKTNIRNRPTKQELTSDVGGTGSTRLTGGGVVVIPFGAGVRPLPRAIDLLLWCFNDGFIECGDGRIGNYQTWSVLAIGSESD